MAEQSRLIKKYPNRRLYDTRTSTYITLADIKQLVLAFENFQVVDAKSGDDLTRAILLQVILEEEAGGAPMFSSDLLANMIRFYGNAMQGMMGRYVENTIRSFTEAQAKLKEQTKAMLYGETAPDSHELWAQFLKFQGPVLQQMMGSYIGDNIRSFTEIQAKLKEQAKRLYGESSVENQDLWAQFFKFQGPAMRHMMTAYVEQSQKMFQQMQDTMQEQTRKIFPGIYVKPEEKVENK